MQFRHAIWLSNHTPEKSPSNSVQKVLFRGETSIYSAVNLPQHRIPNQNYPYAGMSKAYFFSFGAVHFYFSFYLNIFQFVHTKSKIIPQTLWKLPLKRSKSEENFRLSNYAKTEAVTQLSHYALKAPEIQTIGNHLQVLKNSYTALKKFYRKQLPLQTSKHHN